MIIMKMKTNHQTAKTKDVMVMMEIVVMEIQIIMVKIARHLLQPQFQQHFIQQFNPLKFQLQTIQQNSLLYCRHFYIQKCRQLGQQIGHQIIRLQYLVQKFQHFHQLIILHLHQLIFRQKYLLQYLHQYLHQYLQQYLHQYHLQFFQ